MDRNPPQPDPVEGDARTGCNILLAAADIMSLMPKTCRQGRGNRCDSALVRGAGIVAFPVLAASFGETDPEVIYGVWLLHMGIILVMALNRWRLQRKYGPLHSRFVGWSAPEWLGLPSTLSKLMLEP